MIEKNFTLTGRILKEKASATMEKPASAVLTSTKSVSKLSGICFLALLLLFACKEEEHLKPFITVDKEHLAVDALGREDTVRIASNIQWTASDIPDWCTIQEERNPENSLIRIKTTPNKTKNTREARIKISGELVEKHIIIVQAYRKKDKQIIWQHLPTCWFNDVNYTQGKDGVERFYTFSGEDIFINQAIRDKIYPGNLIKNKMERPTELTEYPQYTYNPIQLAFLAGIHISVKETVPSIKALNEFVDEMIKTKPLKQNMGFYYSNTPVKYTTYRQLHLLGMGNLGVELDKLISGSSYRQKEMPENETGYIFSYSVKLFNIFMELPTDGLLIKEKITDKNILNSLCYIDNISYGRTAYLIIETDEEEETVRTIVGKVQRKEALNKQEQSVVDGAKLYYLHYNSRKELRAEKGGAEIITRYTESINKGAIIPLTFSVVNYDHFLPDRTMHLHLHLP